MRSPADIEKIVHRVRNKLGVSELDRFDIIELLSSRVAEHIEGFTLQVWPDSYFDDEEAWYDPDGPKIVTRQCVYDRAQRGVPHDVFTLCHELGHLVLNHQGIRFRKRGKDRQAQHVQAIGDEEQEARIFAAAFIAPASKLYPGIPVEDIRNRFNLSASAADKRKAEIEREWRRINKIERALPGNVIDFIAELDKRK